MSYNNKSDWSAWMWWADNSPNHFQGFASPFPKSFCGILTRWMCEINLRDLGNTFILCARYYSGQMLWNCEVLWSAFRSKSIDKKFLCYTSNLSQTEQNGIIKKNNKTHTQGSQGSTDGCCGTHVVHICQRAQKWNHEMQIKTLPWWIPLINRWKEQYDFILFF